MGNGGAGVGFASPSVGGAGTMAFNVGNSFTYSGTLNNSGGLIKSGAWTTHLEFHEQRPARHDRSRRRHAQRRQRRLGERRLQQRHGADLAGPLGRGLNLTGQWSATNADNYVVNGGLLNPPTWVCAANYFASVNMTGGTISSGCMVTGSVTEGVNINASAGGSVISSNFVMVYQDNTLTFTVAHDGSAPYDLLLNGSIQDYPGIAGTAVAKAGPGLMVISGANAYVGPTTVSAGTLAVNGSLSSTGQVTVSGGASAARAASATSSSSPPRR